MAVGGTVGLLLGLTLAVVAVGSVESLGVAVDGVVAVDVGVLAGQVGLVEVVGMLHVGTTQAGLDDDGGVRADKHGNGTSTTSRAGSTLGVESNVAGNDNGVTTIPGRGLDPVDRVEEGVGTTIAGVDGVDTLEVGVVAKQLHENRLDRLGLVEDGFSADLDTADRVLVDVVFFEEVGGDGQGHGVDVCRGRDS